MPPRLRKSITAPNRYEDGDSIDNHPRRGTRPAFPKLLAAQVVPFDPHARPATFPSLPFTSEPNTPCTTAANSPEPFDLTADWAHVATFNDIDQGPFCNSVDWLRSNDRISAELGLHDQCLEEPALDTEINLRTPQHLAAMVPRATPHFDDEVDFQAAMASSPEPDDAPKEKDHTNCREVGSFHDETIHWSRLALALQIVIFENMLETGLKSAQCARALDLTIEELDAMDRQRRLTIINPVNEETLLEMVNAEWFAGLALYTNPPSISDIMAKYEKGLVRAGHLYRPYEYEIDRARAFLKQKNLSPALAGLWNMDPETIRYERTGEKQQIIPKTVTLKSKRIKQSATFRRENRITRRNREPEGLLSRQGPSTLGNLGAQQETLPVLEKRLPDSNVLLHDDTSPQDERNICDGHTQGSSIALPVVASTDVGETVGRKSLMRRSRSTSGLHQPSRIDESGTTLRGGDGFPAFSTDPPEDGCPNSEQRLSYRQPLPKSHQILRSRSGPLVAPRVKLKLKIKGGAALLRKSSSSRQPTQHLDIGSLAVTGTQPPCALSLQQPPNAMLAEADSNNHSFDTIDNSESTFQAQNSTSLAPGLPASRHQSQSLSKQDRMSNRQTGSCEWPRADKVRPSNKEIRFQATQNLLQAMDWAQPGLSTDIGTTAASSSCRCEEQQSPAPSSPIAPSCSPITDPSSGSKKGSKEALPAKLPRNMPPTAPHSPDPFVTDVACLTKAGHRVTLNLHNPSSHRPLSPSSSEIAGISRGTSPTTSDADGQASLISAQRAAHRVRSRLFNAANATALNLSKVPAVPLTTKNAKDIAQSLKSVAESIDNVKQAVLQDRGSTKTNTAAEHDSLSPPETEVYETEQESSEDFSLRDQRTSRTSKSTPASDGVSDANTDLATLPAPTSVSRRKYTKIRKDKGVKRGPQRRTIEKRLKMQAEKLAEARLGDGNVDS